MKTLPPSGLLSMTRISASPTYAQPGFGRVKAGKTKI
jgi:hypothetical protein